jgi:hypothetical protein
MIQEEDHPQQNRHDASFERHLWGLLDAASPRWAKVELPEENAVVQGAFARLVRSGQIQVRMDVLARGLPGEPRVRATVIVTGDYTKVLAGHVRAAVPEFTGRIAVTPQLPVEYRLSRAGHETRREMREFGGGPWEEGFLSASLAFVIPGAVSIRNLVYEEQESNPATDSGATATAPTDPEKRPRTAAWPLHKTEGHVAAYLDRKKNLYRKLAGNVLDGMPGAYQEFRRTFGPTSIAETITMKVGAGNHRGCDKRDVCKTLAYQRRVQPLLRNPPEKPDDWDEVLKSRHGEALPDILDEIPFEDGEL